MSVSSYIAIIKKQVLLERTFLDGLLSLFISRDLSCRL